MYPELVEAYARYLETVAERERLSDEGDELLRQGDAKHQEALRGYYASREAFYAVVQGLPHPASVERFNDGLVILGLPDDRFWVWDGEEHVYGPLVDGWRKCEHCGHAVDWPSIRIAEQGHR